MKHIENSEGVSTPPELSSHLSLRFEMGPIIPQ